VVYQYKRVKSIILGLNTGALLLHTHFAFLKAEYSLVQYLVQIKKGLQA